MKKTKKFVAIILTVLMLMSAVPLFASAAGAAPDAVKSQSVKECSIYDGDELEIDKTVNVNIRDTVNFDEIEDSEFTYAEVMSTNSEIIEINFDKNSDYSSAVSFTAVDYGVVVLTVFGYKEIFDEINDEYNYDIVGEYTWLVIVNDPDGMGSVTGITAFDETFRYKEAFSFSEPNITWVHPVVETADESPAYYAVIYSTPNYTDSNVFLDGTVVTNFVGVNNCTVYVIDADGQIFTDNCTITVSYTWWQQIIMVFLFGWLWY